MLIESGSAKKGDVIGVAGSPRIQGAKRTSELMPLCHPIALTRVAVEFELVRAADGWCTAQVETFGRTGVEMEALTAVQVGLLTVYDMCKAVDRAWSSTTCGCWRSAAASRATGWRRRARRVGAHLESRSPTGFRREALEGQRAGARGPPARAAGAAVSGPVAAATVVAAQGAKNSSAWSCGTLQPGGDEARLVGLADLVERLGPGQHQPRVEQEVRRAPERLQHRARMLGDGRRGVVGMVREQDAALAVGDALVERRGVGRGAKMMTTIM